MVSEINLESNYLEGVSALEILSSVAQIRHGSSKCCLLTLLT